jgi:hypothetical protein
MTAHGVALAILCLSLSSCAGGFTRHNAGIGTLYIGDRLSVERECVKRGVVVPSTDRDVWGCCDFARREMFAVENAKVIRYERCHLDNLTESHAVCPSPVLP